MREPATGQMLSRDPIATQTRQPYAYASNDPTDQTDPTGLYGIGDFVDDVTGTVGEVDDVIKNGQSAEFLGNEIIGAANTLSFGASNNVLGIDYDCLGIAGDIGGVLGLAIPGGQALRAAQEAGTLSRLGERLADETGAVRFGARHGLPALDRSSKVHGSIPSHVSPRLTREQLEGLAADLETSIGTRETEQVRLGEDGSHRFRIEQEGRFLRQVRGALGG